MFPPLAKSRTGERSYRTTRCQKARRGQCPEALLFAISPIAETFTQLKFSEPPGAGGNDRAGAAVLLEDLLVISHPIGLLLLGLGLGLPEHLGFALRSGAC